jgi:hypothetical protein
MLLFLRNNQHIRLSFGQKVDQLLVGCKERQNHSRKNRSPWHWEDQNRWDVLWNTGLELYTTAINHQSIATIVHNLSLSLSHRVSGCYQRTVLGRCFFDAQR